MATHATRERESGTIRSVQKKVRKETKILLQIITFQPLKGSFQLQIISFPQRKTNFHRQKTNTLPVKSKGFAVKVFVFCRTFS